jgi:hypothetical protein
LAQVQADKASTGRADAIEGELRALRQRLDRSRGGVGSANPLQALLSNIFGAFADMMIAWQKAVFAVIYDLSLIAIMVGIEVLGHVAQSVARAGAGASPPIDVTPTVVSTMEAIEEPAMTLSPKPRLVAQEKSRARGVAVYLAERLQPRPGARVEMEECQAAYAASGLRSLTTEEFVESLQHFCLACGVKTKVVGEKVYLLNVELADEHLGAPSRLGHMGREKRT